MKKTEAGWQPPKTGTCTTQPGEQKLLYDNESGFLAVLLSDTLVSFQRDQSNGGN